MGTFGTTLLCSATSGSATSTPSIDEDCDGSFDNIKSTVTWSCSGHGGAVCLIHPGCGISTPLCWTQAQYDSWFATYGCYPGG